MRMLVTGASGQLGSYLLRSLGMGSHCVTAWSGSRTGELFGHRLRPVDLTNRDLVAAAYRAARPSVVIHLAAVSTVSDCYRDAAQAELVNVAGTGILGELADQTGARLVYLSTDLVFDGEDAPYREQALPSPLSLYGRTKAAAEELLRGLRRSTVVRSSLLYGVPINGGKTFFDQQVQALRSGKRTRAFTDEWRAPLSVQAAAEGLRLLAESDFEGLVHMGGPERLSRFEMAQRLANWLGADPATVVPAKRADLDGAEPRPRDVTLDSSRWRDHFPNSAWPAFEAALSDFDLARSL